MGDSRCLLVKNINDLKFSKKLHYREKYNLTLCKL